jgi:hypothetical protein
LTPLTSSYIYGTAQASRAAPDGIRSQKMTTQNHVAVLQYGYAFCGVGETADDAVDDAAEWLDGGREQALSADWLTQRGGVHGKLYLVDVTPALAARIKCDGGQVGCEELPDGTFCLPEELPGATD